MNLDEFSKVFFPNENEVIHFRAFKPKDAQDWLSHQFYKVEGNPLFVSTLQDVIRTISGQAKFESVEPEVYVRLAYFEREIYLDLCNKNWQVIEIATNSWQVIESKDAPVQFRRIEIFMFLKFLMSIFLFLWLRTLSKNLGGKHRWHKNY